MSDICDIESENMESGFKVKLRTDLSNISAVKNWISLFELKTKTKYKMSDRGDKSGVHQIRLKCQHAGPKPTPKVRKKEKEIATARSVIVEPTSKLIWRKSQAMGARFGSTMLKGKISRTDLLQICGSQTIYVSCISKNQLSKRD